MYEVGVQERRRSTPLPRKSVVLEVRPISPSAGYVYARVSRSRRGFSKWSYQRIKSLSLSVWKRHVPARNIPRRFTRYRAPHFLPLKSYEVWAEVTDDEEGGGGVTGPLPRYTGPRKKNGRKGISLG